MNGSPLQQALKRLIVEVINEEQKSTGNLRPELGTVLSLNGDGTIAVQTDANHYPNCGAATQDCYVIGLQVMVLCADGMQVAIPSTQSVAVMT